MFLCWYERYVDTKGGLNIFKKNFPNGCHPKRHPHFHSCIELTFLVQGQLEITVENQTHLLTPGDMCYIDSFKRHKYRYLNEAVAYVVVIHPTLFDEKNGLGGICFAEHSHPKADVSQITEFLEFFYNRRDLSDLLFKSAFVDMLVYLLKKHFDYFPKEQRAKHERSFFDSVIYISDHCKEDLHVADVAAKFGYTPNYYSATFKRNLGISFRDFLNQCRISDFRRLRSENKGLSVEKLVELCGFGSLNAYYRTQRKLEQFQAN